MKDKDIRSFLPITYISRTFVGSQKKLGKFDKGSLHNLQGI